MDGGKKRRKKASKRKKEEKREGGKDAGRVGERKKGQAKIAPSSPRSLSSYWV